MDVPQARRIERPRWLNARVTLGSLLFIVSLVGGQRLIADARDLTPVWTAVRDIPAGTVISREDLAPVGVNLPATVLGTYALASTPIEGATVVEALSSGEIVALSSVADTPAEIEGRLITIPLGEVSAVVGDLRVGDKVDVLATFDAGEDDAVTHAVVVGVEVVEVIRSGGFVSEEGAIAGVAVRVSPPDASRLAFAIRNAQIDLVKVTGEASSGPIDVVTRQDFRP